MKRDRGYKPCHCTPHKILSKIGFAFLMQNSSMTTFVIKFVVIERVLWLPISFGVAGRSQSCSQRHRRLCSYLEARQTLCKPKNEKQVEESAQEQIADGRLVVNSRTGRMVYIVQPLSILMHINLSPLLFLPLSSKKFQYLSISSREI